MTRFLGFLSVSLLAFMSGLAETAPVAAAPPADLTRLFEIGWKPSFQVLDAAQAEYERLQADTPDDSRLTYALALVQLKHRRYERASELLSEAVAAQPEDLELRRGLIWTLMILKRHDAALVAMAEMVERLPEPANEDAPAVAASRFLGRMFGYLEGPGASGSPAAAEDCVSERDRLRENLTASRGEAFDAGRSSVLEKFDELSLAHEDAQSQAKVVEAKNRERVGQRLDQEKEQVAAEKADVDQQAKAAEEQYAAEITPLDKKLTAIDVELGKINSAGRAVLANLTAVRADLDRWTLIADTSKNPVERDRALRQVLRLRPVAQQLDLEYASLDVQAARLNAQRAEIESARDVVQNTYDNTMHRLGRTAGKLRKTEKRISADEKKFDRPPTGSNPATRAKAAQATAFSTYEAYPLEKEKQRLLEQQP